MGVLVMLFAMLVMLFGVLVVMLGCSRFGVVFEGAAGSQDVPSGGLRRHRCGQGCLKGDAAPFGLVISFFMVRGFAGGVKPQKRLGATKGIAKGTLPFCGLGLTNVREKARMRGAKLVVIGARLVQAELAVHRQSHLEGVLVLLAVILPPADRAQLQGSGRIERPVSAARTTKTGFGGDTHIRMDGKMPAKDYAA
jgi:hypothetical protein